jgi:hypothetical protein
MKLKSLTPLALAAVAAFGAPAVLAKSAINYNYVGIQYFNQDLDDAHCDQDGLDLNGSFAINREFFVRGSYADADGNHGCGSESLNLGVGYRWAFRGNADFYAVVGFDDISPDHGESDSGLVLAGGVRTFLTNELEGKLELAHHTVYDGDNEIRGGLVYFFDANLALTGDVSLGSDQTSFGVGIRYNF